MKLFRRVSTGCARRPLYKRAIEYLEDEVFIKQLRPADVVQIMKIHLETTHKLGRSVADAPGGSAAVDWTPDEQRELDKLLGEIESEEAKEEPSSGSGAGDEGLENVEDEQD